MKQEASGQHDPSSPLDNPKHEIYVQARITGKSLEESLIQAFPKSATWTSKSRRNRAMRLEQIAVILRRMEWLKAKAASGTILTRQQRMEMLSRAATNADAGLKPYLGVVTPDGDLGYNVTPDNITNAVEMIEQRIEPHPEGDGRDDAVIRKIKVRDSLPYLAELNKMDGQYAPVKQEIDAGGAVAALLSAIQSETPKWTRRKSAKNNLPG